MIGFLTSLFSGGTVSAIERIASEAIETDKESAEAKALFVKTLDPNGKMRRDLSIFASLAYGYYLVVVSILSMLVAFGVGDAVGAAKAAEMMKDLFMPITTAWAGIVGASFGVNGLNSHKGK